MDQSESTTSCHSNSDMESSKDDSSHHETTPPVSRHQIDDNRKNNRVLNDVASLRQPPCPAPRASLEIKGHSVSKRSKVESESGSPVKSTDPAFPRQPPCPAPRTSVEVKGCSSNNSQRRSEVKSNSSPMKRSKVSGDEVLQTESTSHRNTAQGEYNATDKTSMEQLRERVTKDALKSDEKTKNNNHGSSKLEHKSQETSLQRSPSPRRPESRTRPTDSPSRNRSESKGHNSPSAMRHPELPPIIRDPKSGEVYKRGRLLGKVSLCFCF